MNCSNKDVCSFLVLCDTLYLSSCYDKWGNFYMLFRKWGNCNINLWYNFIKLEALQLPYINSRFCDCTAVTEKSCDTPSCGPAMAQAVYHSVTIEVWVQSQGSPSVICHESGSGH